MTELEAFLGQVDFEDSSDMDVYRDAFNTLFVRPKLELIEDRIKSLDSMATDIAIQVVAPLMGTIDDRVLRQAFTHEQLTEGVDYTYYHSTYPTDVHVAYSGGWMRVRTTTPSSEKFFGVAIAPDRIEKEPEPGSFDEVMNELVEQITPDMYLWASLHDAYSVCHKTNLGQPALERVRRFRNVVADFISDPCSAQLDRMPIAFAVPLDTHITNNTAVLSPEGVVMGRIFEPHFFRVIEASPCYMVFANAGHEEYNKLTFVPASESISSDELKSHFTTW